jgi:hypothetical protein
MLTYLFTHEEEEKSIKKEKKTTKNKRRRRSLREEDIKFVNPNLMMMEKGSFVISIVP